MILCALLIFNTVIKRGDTSGGFFIRGERGGRIINLPVETFYRVKTPRGDFRHAKTLYEADFCR